MAGVITALRCQQRNRERVNVYLDGEFAFGLAAVEAAGLSKGQALSDEEIQALRAQDERQLAFDRAVRFLSYRPRSRQEVERYLIGKKVEEEVIQDVIARLESAAYVDDQAFARFWVENRQRFKPRSRRALNYELRQKGVDRQVIETALEDLSDEEAAWQAIESRLLRWKDLDRETLRHKATGFLQRRGFAYDTVRSVIEQASQALEEMD